MSTPGLVAELVDGQTHHAFMWNEKNMHYSTNRSGESVTSGDVVVLDTSTARSFKTTTTAGDPLVLGVVPQKDGTDGVAADQTLAALATGAVQFAGDIGKVNVDRATAIGQFLIASAVAKKAMPVSAWQQGVFGLATTASAGAGTVCAILFPVYPVVDHTKLSTIGTNTHAQIDTHLGAGANVHGLPASVGVLGDRSGTGQWVQHGSAAVNGNASITFSVAFAGAPLVLITALDVGGAAQYAGVESVTATGFTCRTSANTTVHWLAIGG